jgi:hypothetical protein
MPITIKPLDFQPVRGVPEIEKEFRMPKAWAGKKIKLRFRQNDWAYVFVRDEFGIQKYPIIEKDGCWLPDFNHCIGANLRSPA